MKTIAQVCRNILLRVGGGADWDYLCKESALRSIVAASGHKQLMALVGALAPRARQIMQIPPLSWIPGTIADYASLWYMPLIE